MATLDVYSFLEESMIHKSVPLDGVVSVSDLRALLSVYFEIEPYSFDLLHRTSSIKDDQLMSELKLNKNSKVFMQPAIVPQQEPTLDMAAFTTAANSLKKILTSKVARNIVAKKLQNQILVDCIVNAVPEFGEDYVAISIITSKELLWSLLTKSAEEWERILSVHPSLSRVIMFLEEALKNENLDKAPIEKSLAQDARSMYSIDHMSDDDDDDEEDQSARLRRNQPMDIAANFPRVYPQYMSSTPAGSESQPSTSSVITTDYFQQAMMMSMAGISNNSAQPFPNQSQLGDLNPSAAHSPIGGEEDMAEKLNQLREMGFTDDELARRVLLQTGGNLQLTLEILFEGNI